MRARRVFPFLVAVIASPLSAIAADGPSAKKEKSLTAAAGDPTEPLIQVTTDNDVAITNRGGDYRSSVFLYAPGDSPVHRRKARKKCGYCE